MHEFIQHKPWNVHNDCGLHAQKYRDQQLTNYTHVADVCRKLYATDKSSWSF